MNIQQFQYILAVVEERNFEAAAEQCHVTQSTLSTMIGRFENEIGITVFNRKTKPVSVTAEGQKIIDRLRIINGEINSLKNVVQELKGESTGELKIGIIPTIAPYLLPRFLTRFAEKFPEVRTIVKELTTAQIQQQLKTRSIDVGILALPLDDHELVETELYNEPFLVYDCSDAQSSDSVDVHDLDFGKLCLLQEGHCLRTQVRRLCELNDLYAGSDDNFEFESGSMDSLLRITESRKGITILPFLATLELAETQKRRLVRFKEPVPVRQVGLITHSFFVKKKLLKSLKSMITESIGDFLEDDSQIEVLQPV
jgi:LysR family hydrogen peroxide-inducible transcriptional activator